MGHVIAMIMCIGLRPSRHFIMGHIDSGAPKLGSYTLWPRNTPKLGDNICGLNYLSLLSPDMRGFDEICRSDA
jgi:hypothetical protein